MVLAANWLGRLVGFRLFSVQFVMDYVQLRFDSSPSDMPVLTCNVLPAVELTGRSLTHGTLGYGDALRAFIPKVVTKTHEQTGIGLHLEFDGDAIVLHPRFQDLVGPDVALVQGFEDDAWMCWRPGEGTFEDPAFDPAAVSPAVDSRR